MNSVEFTLLWTDDDGMLKLGVKAQGHVLGHMIWIAHAYQRNAMFRRVRLRVPGNSYKLKLWAADSSVVVQRVTIVRVVPNS